MGRPDSELYRGTRLSRTLEWRERATPGLNDTETAFLDASVALSTAERAPPRCGRPRTQVQASAARRAGRSRRLRRAGPGRRHPRRPGGRQRGAGPAGPARLRPSSPRPGGPRHRPPGRRTRHRAATRGRGPERRALRAGPGHPGCRADPGRAARPRPRLGRDHRCRCRSAPTGGWWQSVAHRRARAGARVFDWATLEPVEYAQTAPSSIIRFSPDGPQLAVAVNQWVAQAPPRIDNQPIQLYDLPGGTLSAAAARGTVPGGSVEYAMDFSGDGRRIAAMVQHYNSRGRRVHRPGGGDRLGPGPHRTPGVRPECPSTPISRSAGTEVACTPRCGGATRCAPMTWTPADCSRCRRTPPPGRAAGWPRPQPRRVDGRRRHRGPHPPLGRHDPAPARARPARPRHRRAAATPITATSSPPPRATRA